MDFQKLILSISLSILLVLAGGCKGSSGGAAAPTPVTPTAPVPSINCGGAISISGNLTYDFVSAASAKLDYAGTTQKPMRNVFIELLNAGDNSVICSTSSNDAGAYAFSMSTTGSVKLRIYAEMISPSVIIQDNTNGDAQYALVTSAYDITASTVKNVRATSGWSGSNAGGSYTGARAAAPFAMLDSIYTVIKKINSARPAIVFPLLKVNWSINNIGVDGDKSLGQITTSHYDSGTNQLYILGKLDVDTDEFDNHVVVHEWGHFMESNLSRSDSFGGPHGAGDKKNISLAFGEGWGNAISAIAFDPDISYADTYGSKQQSGFSFSLESSTDTNKGWFSETSVQEILYDIYDSTNEVNDNLSAGLGPILDVMTGYQKTTPSMTSIFSFIYGLKIASPALSADLDTILTSKIISGNNSPYGVGETSDAGWDKNLPIYHSITLGGAAVPVSLYGDSGSNGAFGLYNTVFNNKYLRFTATTTTTRLVVTSTDTFEIDVFKKGAWVYPIETETRTSGAAFGPFTYDVPTIAGQEYIVQLLTDQSAVYYKNTRVSLTVTATGI